MGKSIKIAGANWGYPINLNVFTLSGIVSDGTNPLAGVVVTIDSISTTTANDGSYSLELEAGTYTIQASLNGYETYSQSITISAATSKNITMETELNGDSLLQSLATYFHPQYTLNQNSNPEINNNGFVANAITTRSCVLGAPMGAYIAKGYNRLKITLKSGYDLVIGVSSGELANKTWYDASGSNTSFGWITTTDSVTIPISSSQPYIAINLKAEDGSDMSANGIPTDYIDSIELSTSNN